MKEANKTKLLGILLLIVLFSACVAGCKKQSTPEPINTNTHTIQWCNPQGACFAGIYRCDLNPNITFNDTNPIGAKIKYIFLGYDRHITNGHLDADSLVYEQQFVDFDLNVLNANSRINIRLGINVNYPNLGLQTKSGKYITFYEE